jgi:hypothetical protein
MQSLKFRLPPSSSRCPERCNGKVLTLFAVLVPVLLGFCGLVIDGSMLLVQRRSAQHAADAAATAAAAALAEGKSANAASSVAVSYVQNDNELASAAISVQIPPSSGPHAGQAGFVEVQVTQPVPTYLIQAVGASSVNHVRATAIAGRKPATSGAAIVVLDPDPPGLDLPAILSIPLPTTPSLSLAGLEVLGVGQLRVNGAVLVNTTWGGVDEHGEPAGEFAGFRSAVTCMPLLPLTKLRATDLRVTGGVDDEKNYGSYLSGKPSPLRANRAPVPDPLASLPNPSLAADPVHVSGTLQGGVSVLTLPLGPTTRLTPGVYDYIRITAGNVVMESGVYIIRSRHPLTGISLEIVGGQVTAEGVMFYIIDDPSFTPSSSAPDAEDPPPPLMVQITPISAVINAGLLGSRFTPLSETGSVYDGTLLFQNRADRRIIVVARDTLLSSGSLSGTIYAKWGHVVFSAMGTFDARFVVGSIRFVNVLDVTLQPSHLLPPAQDVFLVQ